MTDQSVIVPSKAAAKADGREGQCRRINRSKGSSQAAANLAQSKKTIGDTYIFTLTNKNSKSTLHDHRAWDGCKALFRFTRTCKETKHR